MSRSRHLKTTSSIMAGDASNGAANGSKTTDDKQMTPTYRAVKDDQPSRVNRGQVEGTFSKYAQLIHASRRPLPTESGDGTYLGEKKKGTSLFQDLRTVGFKGIKTIIAVGKSKKKGDLVDDRTYLMEKIIAVSIDVKVTPRLNYC